MELAGFKHGSLFSLCLLMLVATYASLADGQQDTAGISLRLHGVTIPNNSLVDIKDILYRTPDDPHPTNADSELHDQALLCVTDLEDCCAAPRTVRGDWYYPNGSMVTLETRGFLSFQRNRGPNEIINGRQFYGSVRLWRRYSRPPGRGRFHCELPSAADPSVNQTLYANIVEFNNQIALSPSGPAIAGNPFSLMCSATLNDPIPLPFNVPSPTFEWFFGPNGNASLPSGVIPTATALKTCSIYTSTLQFFPALNELHSGNYTCRLGAGRLTSSTVILVNESGVSLRLHGVNIPNNSLVDIDDILYSTSGVPGPNTPGNLEPTNANGLHDQTLVCVTDLEDCCESPHTVRGDWYYPDGGIVPFDTDGATFRRNRGPNEVINGRKFYGSVRIWRRWGLPPGRGRFRCELPSAADPNVTQTLYANIINFDSSVTPSSSGFSIAGNTFSLTCSATLISPIPLPSNVPSPIYQWFYGPNGNDSLPSGVIPSSTLNKCFTYSSTLQFSPLNQSHAGMYTCRLGPGLLAISTVVSVNIAVIQMTSSGTPILGQRSYSLTCKVLMADNLCLSITYRWIKNNSTTIQYGTESNTLSFSPLTLSNAGQYTCYATVSSVCINKDVTVVGTYDVRIQIPAPTSLLISSSIPNPVRPIGSAVTLTCLVKVELSPLVDVPATVITVWTAPTGFMTTNTSQPIMGGTITYNSTVTVSSFGRTQSGVYTCTATLNSMLFNAYLINSSAAANSTRITSGVYLALRSEYITNNSQLNIKNIGLSNDNPNGALKCITDDNPCCLNMNHRRGEWYLPNRTMINESISATMFYTNRGDNGEVSLNRPSNAMSPTGQFCCKVPDATGTIQTLCVIIGVVSVTPLGSPIAGESYTLECSAGGTTTTFEWLGPLGGRTPVVNSSFVTISSSSSTSQLQFRPLQQSHNGSYSCRAMTDEDTLLSEHIEIGVNAPSILVQISDSASGAVPAAGEDFGLMCSVHGAENLNPITTYRWIKSGEIKIKSNTFSFLPVRVSDAGNYSCSVTIASTYLAGEMTAVSSRGLRIRIPTPSITLTSSKDDDSSDFIVGSDITLTCTLELHTAILDSEIFLLTVDTQLSRDGSPLALTGPTVTGTTFTYTTQLNSFGKNDYGNYTCTATVRPQPSLTYLTGTEVLSETLTFKAVLPPPVGARATQSSSSAPVEVSWSPPSDYEAFNITGYRIFFDDGKNVSVSTIITNIGVRVNGSFDGEIVFLRSESHQLYSKLVIVTVEDSELCCARDTSMPPYSWLSAVGVTACLVVVIAIVVLLVLCCLWRNKSSIKKGLGVSENVAYNLRARSRETDREYENVDIILESSAQWKNDESVCATSKQQAL